MSSMLGFKSFKPLPTSATTDTTRTLALSRRVEQNLQRFTCRHANKQHKRQCLSRAASSSTEIDGEVREPEDARGAISIGLGLYEAGKYAEALEVFEKGLELPGTGMKRFR